MENDLKLSNHLLLKLGKLVILILWVVEQDFHWNFQVNLQPMTLQTIKGAWICIYDGSWVNCFFHLLCDSYKYYLLYEASSTHTNTDL